MPEQFLKIGQGRSPPSSLHATEHNHRSPSTLNVRIVTQPTNHQSTRGSQQTVQKRNLTISNTFRRRIRTFVRVQSTVASYAENSCWALNVHAKPSMQARQVQSRRRLQTQKVFWWCVAASR